MIYCCHLLFSVTPRNPRVEIETLRLNTWDWNPPSNFELVAGIRKSQLPQHTKLLLTLTGQCSVPKLICQRAASSYVHSLWTPRVCQTDSLKGCSFLACHVMGTQKMLIVDANSHWWQSAGLWSFSFQGRNTLRNLEAASRQPGFSLWTRWALIERTNSN